MTTEQMTPAPWDTEGADVVNRQHATRVAACAGDPNTDNKECLANAEFIALAKNAFDVMMRRGWVPSREHLWGDPSRFGKEAWIVRHPRTKESIAKGGTAYDLLVGPIVGELGSKLIWADDPFTALCAADAWYKANIESKAS